MSELEELLVRVPWDQLEGAYGPVPFVPAMVRQLGDPDPEERTRARETLAEDLNHQGSVYEPAVYLVAPLICLLKTPGFAGCEEVLDLVFRFGRGTGLFTAHQKLSVVRDMYGPEVMAEKVAQEAKWLARLHQELLMGADCFLELLGHSVAEVRAKAIQVLTLLPERRADVLPKLSALAAADPVQSVKETARGALDYLQK